MLRSLSKRTSRRLIGLSERTGQSPAQIIDAGIQLFERHVESIDPDAKEDQDSQLVRLVPDRQKRTIFREVLKILSTHANAKMTDEAKARRAVAGGKARAKKYKTGELKKKGHAVP